MTPLVRRWPLFAAELEAALLAASESALAATVPVLTVLEACDCGEEHCQSFYTVAAPADGWSPPALRNVELDPRCAEEGCGGC